MKPIACALALALAVLAAPAQTGSPAHKYFTDVVLIDQDGRHLRLYTDLIQGKVVIINSFFTTCVSVCPPMTRNLEQVQKWLGDRLGDKVHIISISVDPLTDTPPRMKEYAERFNARPGWYFLTGSEENVAFALSKIGQFVQSKEDHSTVIIIGNEPTGLWKKAFGLAPAPDLIKVAESVVLDKPDQIGKEGVHAFERMVQTRIEAPPRYSGGSRAGQAGPEIIRASGTCRQVPPRRCLVGRKSHDRR